MHETLFTEAKIHKTINTMSLVAYAKAKNGFRLNVKYAARKLVATENVLGTKFAVLKYFNTK